MTKIITTLNILVAAGLYYSTGFLDSFVWPINYGLAVLYMLSLTAATALVLVFEWASNTPEFYEYRRDMVEDWEDPYAVSNVFFGVLQWASLIGYSYINYLYGAHWISYVANLTLIGGIGIAVYGYVRVRPLIQKWGEKYEI